MIPRTHQEAADYLRSRTAQAAQARRQAEHFRRLAELEAERAAALEADAARVRAEFPLPLFTAE